MFLSAKEPVPKPKNTISLQMGEPVKPQAFFRPIKFYVLDVIDRSGDPQPRLVFRRRGGAFVDKEPKTIVRQALVHSLEAAGLLAPDEISADCLLTVYLFHFGLSSGGGREFFSKVDLNVVVKNPRTGKTKQIPALGTSIEKTASRKRKIMKRVQVNMEDALRSAIRSFLRGKKLRDAVESFLGAPPPKLAVESVKELKP